MAKQEELYQDVEREILVIDGRVARTIEGSFFVA
jgi:hypothetical protein